MGEAPDQWEPADPASARPDGPDWVLTGHKASVEARPTSRMCCWCMGRTGDGMAQFLPVPPPTWPACPRPAPPP